MDPHTAYTKSNDVNSIYIILFRHTQNEDQLSKLHLVNPF